MTPLSNGTNWSSKSHHCNAPKSQIHGETHFSFGKHELEVKS
jgi:hypothetical protein